MGDRLLKRCKIVCRPFSKEETAYLTLHLLGGKFRYTQDDGSARRSDQADSHPSLPQLVEQLIRRMSELNMIPFPGPGIIERVESAFVHDHEPSSLWPGCVQSDAG